MVYIHKKKKDASRPINVYTHKTNKCYRSKSWGGQRFGERPLRLDAHKGSDAHSGTHIDTDSDTDSDADSNFGVVTI